MAKGKVGKTVETLGDYLREQRVNAQLSLRQLAEQTGVSNPYLSQIERGLRRPSAEVLQQLAKALRISAEQLYVQAGILKPDDGRGALRGAGDPRRPGPERAAEAVAAGRLRVLPCSEQPPHRSYLHPNGRNLNMAKNPKFNVKLPSEAVRPLYAAAGVTDLAVEIARGYVTEAQVKVTDAQKKASQRVSSVDLEPKALQTKAVSLMNARVDELSKEAKARQERVEKAYAELQGQAKALPAKIEAYLNGTIADLNGTYVGLAARGETLVTRILGQQATQDAKAAANTTVAKAKSTKTSAGKAASATTTSAKGTATTAKNSAAKAASDTKSRAKGTATTAKKAAKAPQSNAKATGTAATTTAAKATEATTAAAQKIGD